MTEPRTPQTIAAHMTHILAPAVRAAEALTQPNPRLRLYITGNAKLLTEIDLVAIAHSLAGERAQASAGRPRGSSNGAGSKGAVTSTTEDCALELDRISDIGLMLAEAIDRLHPDPSWPPITSGIRTRLQCATEHTLATAAGCFDTLNPERSYDDLEDSVDGLCIAVREVLKRAETARRTRAWFALPAQVDLPDTAREAALEAARCTSWPLGKDRNGEPARCGNYRGEHGHRHPDTDSAHHDDLCDDCYMLVCPQCWSRVRRTPKAKECDACEIRNRRGKKAA